MGRRPEAMGHLLQFFKESGKHLDPRTRFLISVVTKVINFSPRGLEQYVKRALAEGATPDEVLDAVLCSYPCAGLTKVVDAIDVILDLNLPGFEARAAPPGEAGAGPGSGEPAAARDVPPADSTPPGQAARWVQVADLTEIPPGAVLRVLAGLHDLALFNVGGALFALENRCPHKDGPLAAGRVTGNTVKCPLHGWTFHLPSGESLDHPGARAATYAVRIGDAGKVEVLIPSTSRA
jgi:nitrite reductase/ring-hydroxylating ferredoxin subunit